MAEYRNVEPLKKEIADLKRTIHSENTDYQTGYMSALSVVEGMIAELPAADVEPVRRGKWLNTRAENKKMCSCCGIIHFIAQYPFGKINYCPNCGARMDAKMGGEENG